MAQQVKVLASKCGSLSSSPRDPRNRRREPVLELVLWLPYSPIFSLNKYNTNILNYIAYIILYTMLCTYSDKQGYSSSPPVLERHFLVGMDVCLLSAPPILLHQGSASQGWFLWNWEKKLQKLGLGFQGEFAGCVIVLIIKLDLAHGLHGGVNRFVFGGERIQPFPLHLGDWLVLVLLGKCIEDVFWVDTDQCLLFSLIGFKMEHFDASHSTYFRALLGPRGKVVLGFAHHLWLPSHPFMAACKYCMRRS